MESEVCMNGLCGASLAAAGDHKKGWALRSGDFANLCDKCGTAYEQLAFCELFHLEDTGWRECTTCGKRLHCGCIASSAFLELLDNGGVSCVSCSNSLRHNPNTSEEKPRETGLSVENSVGGTQSSSIDNHVNVGDFEKIMLTKLNDGAADNDQKSLLPSGNDDASRSPMKHEENFRPSGENSTLNGTSESVHEDKLNKYREISGLKDVYGSLVQTNLTIGLAASPGKPVFFPGTAWPRHILPKEPKSILSQGISSQIRVARPPVDGRIKNQLLPRYWPRITEKELQQISGDSNATIVPLFEKVLSASDAGRIGRLVLPKACAEAYFPPISQPEGLPLRIQDVKGKEWLFQFRFWPNNNSRMYVLEGVTPCIQSMQLQAGDTVTFSRMEPEGKLLMGFRKASTSASVQVPHFQSLKGCSDSRLNELTRNINLPNGDVGWHTNENIGSKLRGGSFPPEKKRSRNIGSKSKRLVIESEDALELKHTWEESQDMLFPASLVKPSTVTIEDSEFEEYEEPPVFGKGSIFTICSSGEQEQWAECDNCSKWRRLPADFLLPPRWTCQDNVWDQSRAACLAPDELGPREVDNLLRLAKDFHRRKNSVAEEEQQGYAVAMTTKHPRHRPGCSCIVCIQPPSGKGKHKPNCTCNVCMTVKRRFKTLMLRKKKRQSEQQEEEAKVTRKEEESSGQLELNIHPHGNRVSMMSLVQVANLPLETYLKQNGLTSLIPDQQVVTSSSQALLPQQTQAEAAGDQEDDDNELQVPESVIQNTISS